MTTEKIKEAGKGKCPKCGSTRIAVGISKPPKFVCLKCGHQFT